MSYILLHVRPASRRVYNHENADTQGPWAVNTGSSDSIDLEFAHEFDDQAITYPPWLEPNQVRKREGNP